MRRYAFCNEAFGPEPFHQVCRSLASLGYTAIEVAPFTIENQNPAELRRIMIDSGLEFAGLHWLMTSPAGLHVTTPDERLRTRSWEHVRGLIDLAAQLRTSTLPVLVFGSPRQRSTVNGSTRDEATARFTAGLASVAPHAANADVSILVEALPREQSDIVNTLAEAAAIANELDNPAVALIFDTHNTADETAPPADLIRQYFPLIRHVHLNEMNGGYPGTADFDFQSILDTLDGQNYNGWLSIEAFDFARGGEVIARQSIQFLESRI